MESPWLSDNLGGVIRNDPDFLTKCPYIAKDVIGSKLTFMTLVERLGSLLTDVDDKIRSIGTEVLAEVLHNLPKDFLNDGELIHVSTFFAGRLIDHYSVISAALKGILAIIQMDHAPHDIAVHVFQMISQDRLQCRTLRSEDRRCLYKIFQIFLHHHTTELKKLGPDFIYGFISSIDQEKEAKNLLIVFEMLPFFIRTFPLGHLTEETFEIISCYFPIDYRPEISKGSVKREDLAESLQKCMVASPDFGEFCIPLLIEKLDSKLKLAKLDSFKVLIAGCEVFSVDIIKAHLLDLWRIIQNEVLPGMDKDVREQGLNALKSIVKRMSDGAIEMKDEKLLTSVISFILSAGVNSLSDVELNLFLPAVRMMLTAAEASTAACFEVSRKVLPMLMKQYYKENGKEQKVIVLRALTSFIAVCEAQDVSSIFIPELSSTLQELPSLFLGAAQFNDPDVCKEGFHGLAVARKFFNESSREILYKLLNKSISEESNPLVRSEVILCLKAFSQIYPSEVDERIVKVKLRDVHLELGGCTQVFSNLECLCSIAFAEPFTSVIVPFVMQLIVESYSLEKCTIGMKCLRNLLESSETSKNFQFLGTQCKVVSCLISWWLNGVTEDKHSFIFSNEDLLCSTAKIIDIIIKNQDEGVQNDVASKNLPQIMNSNKNISNGFKFLSKDCCTSWIHTVKVVLLESLIGSLRREIRLFDFNELVTELVACAVVTPHHVIHISASRLSANLINKAPEDENLQKILELILGKLLNAITENSEKEKINSVKVMIWITKSLVIRDHPEMKNWVHSLIKLLALPALGLITAQGFDLILKDDVDYLRSENFCNIRILYHQRFFTFSSTLIELFHNAELKIKFNYLVALGCMLQRVPHEVLLMNLDKMVPLLLESLQQEDEALLTTTLDTIHSVFKESNQTLLLHLQTFIPHILNLTKFKNSMNVRIKAMQCIYQIHKCPTISILPFKNQVLKVLQECLDDHKRLVRKEAVLARSRWFLVGRSLKR